MRPGNQVKHTEIQNILTVKNLSGKSIVLANEIYQEMLITSPLMR